MGKKKGKGNSAQADARVFCHDDAMEVFKLGKAEIWAGSRTEILSTWGWTATISALTALEVPKCPVTVNGDGKEFFSHGLWDYKPPPMLAIAWPDMGVPALSRGWWSILATTLAAKAGRIGIYCQGGHGRTGTALAILGSLGGVIPEGDDPVEWVRGHYCEKACESNDQMDYVESITGRVVAVSVAKGLWYGYGTLAQGGVEVGSRGRLGDPKTDSPGTPWKGV